MSRKSKLLNQEAVNWLDDWADLREPTPYLLHMSCAHMQYSREGEDHLYRRNTFAELYPDHQVLRDLELQQLVEDLRQTSVEQGRSTPLPQPEMAALPDLFQMLDQCTGNVWLDAVKSAWSKAAVTPNGAGRISSGWPVSGAGPGQFLMACCSCSIGKRECPGRCGKAFGRPRRFSRRPCKDTTP